MRTRWTPLVAGILTLLIMFPVLWWAWLALFTSVFGLMLAGVIAHGVGTAVAMFLDLPTAKLTLRLVSWRAGVALVCSVFLWFAVPATYKTIIYMSFDLYRAYNGFEAILGAAIAYALCTAIVRRVEPAWNRYAAPLAVVAMVATTIIVLVLSSQTAPGANQLPPGRPNMPGPQ